jgi:Kef-type K+ transport system membrane component KefB
MHVTNLLIAATLAVLAPLVVDVLPRITVPVAVIEVLLGIVAGPQVLGLLHVDGVVSGFSEFGLAFLFFLAGVEVDLGRIRGRPLAVAGFGWGISVLLAAIVAIALYAAGLDAAPQYLALALVTTALGALLPALADAGQLRSGLGRLVMACGAVGEFGPIVCIALVLDTTHRHVRTVLALNLFVVAVLAAVLVARRWRPDRLIRLVRQTMHSSGQLAVRLSVLLLLALIALASAFGLDVLLGAYSAGMIVNQVIDTADPAGAEHLRTLQAKYEGIGFGFAIPVFFVTTGADFDLRALLAQPWALGLMLVFLALFVAVRGLPGALLARRAGLLGSPVPAMLLTATALPLVVTVTNLALADGAMSAPVAAALVGAAVLSVLVFPATALSLPSRSP